MIDFKLDDKETGSEENKSQLLNQPFAANPTVIKVIGCGGGGSSTVKRMIEAGVQDVEFVVVNTDLQALYHSPAQNKVAIGQKLTGGLGAGGNPAVGEAAAKEDVDKLKEVVEGANMVVVTAGMGGGTGTGSAPVVAQVAREAGALTVAVVTTPFEFEASERMEKAKEGLQKLRDCVDSLIIIPNEQVLKTEGRKLNFLEAYRMADQVVCQGIQGITEIITKEGTPSLDFADVKSVMKDQGEAILGKGYGEGENRAIDAAQSAITNPMLANTTIDGASRVLINIISDGSLSIDEVNEIVNSITATCAEKRSVFWGMVLDESMGDKVSVTVIATGFKENAFAAAIGEDSREKDEDVVSYGTFEKIINGGKILEENDSTSASQKVSTLAFDKSSIFDDYEEKKSDSASAETEKSDSQSLKNGFELPSGMGTIDKNDLSVPAAIRNRLNNLSRSIKLTDD